MLEKIVTVRCGSADFRRVLFTQESIMDDMQKRNQRNQERYFEYERTTRPAWAARGHAIVDAVAKEILANLTDSITLETQVHRHLGYDFPLEKLAYIVCIIPAFKGWEDPVPFPDGMEPSTLAGMLGSDVSWGDGVTGDGLLRSLACTVISERIRWLRGETLKHRLPY